MRPRFSLAGSDHTRRCRGIGLALAAVIAVFAAQYWAVRATNFGGVDEWLYIDLSSRGVLGIPYANRPLVLLGTTVASKIWPDDLRSYWLVHGLYLCLAACLTTLLARRILPDDDHREARLDAVVARERGRFLRDFLG